MTDLTKITTPFGLLDKDTQDTLKAAFEAGVNIEAYTSNGWELSFDPKWYGWTVYRAKPEPVRVDRLFALFGKPADALGCHRVTCNPDGTEPTVTWEPSQ